MQHTAGDTPDSSRRCPACDATLAPEAILCVACGYHLKLGHHLATVVDSPPTTAPPTPPATNPNPYAPPETLAGFQTDGASDRREPPVFDLTESAARQAAAVVSDAQMVYAVIVLSCLCAPAWLVLLPGYVYRLFCWYQLQAAFAELRTPHGFSQHVELAMKFQNARGRLWVGVAVGLLFWILMALKLASVFAGRR